MSCILKNIYARSVGKLKGEYDTMLAVGVNAMRCSTSRRHS